MQFVGGFWKTLKFIDRAKAGQWPIGGGILDQSKSFLDAAEYFWDELAAARPKPEE
jgi:hypothetical protein